MRKTKEEMLEHIRSLPESTVFEVGLSFTYDSFNGAPSDVRVGAIYPPQPFGLKENARGRTTYVMTLEYDIHE